MATAQQCFELARRYYGTNRRLPPECLSSAVEPQGGDGVRFWDRAGQAFASAYEYQQIHGPGSYPDDPFTDPEWLGILAAHRGMRHSGPSGSSRARRQGSRGQGSSGGVVAAGLPGWLVLLLLGLGVVALVKRG